MYWQRDMYENHPDRLEQRELTDPVTKGVVRNLIQKLGLTSVTRQISKKTNEAWGGKAGEEDFAHEARDYIEG